MFFILASVSRVISMQRRLRSLMFRANFRSLPIVAVLLLAASNARTQQMRGVAVQGYVTSVQTDGFDVHGSRVMLQPSTSYGLEKDKTSEADSPLKNELKVGAYVWVLGSNKHDVTVAQTVLFRDDWNKKYEGFGPIERVVSSGSEPVFAADGFPIRIVASTRETFHGRVQSIADVGANDWLHYKARRDPSGVLIATDADFVSIEPKRVKVVNGEADLKLKFEAPDLAAHKDGRIMLGVVGKWYTIPADQPLQERLARIGAKLVPPLQRGLSDDDPGKIKFLFYAVDDRKLHNILCSPRGGLVLVPKHLLQRLHDDDQVATVLAYGLATVLQRQGLTRIKEQGPVLRDEISMWSIALFAPVYAVVPLDLAGALPDHQVQAWLEEQCGRIALALMADAGYDPWQAPEAVRLVAPKELPGNLSALKYTDLSGYLLGVLHLEYSKAPAAGSSASSDEQAK